VFKTVRFPKTGAVGTARNQAELSGTEALTGRPKFPGKAPGAPRDLCGPSDQAAKALLKRCSLLRPGLRRFLSRPQREDLAAKLSAIQRGNTMRLPLHKFLSLAAMPASHSRFHVAPYAVSSRRVVAGAANDQDRCADFAGRCRRHPGPPFGRADQSDARTVDGDREPPRGGQYNWNRSCLARRARLLALMPRWRQNYPNNRPPTRATAISEMGQSTKSLRDSPLRGDLRRAQ
jgi:hypothetical protein